MVRDQAVQETVERQFIVCNGCGAEERASVAADAGYQGTTVKGRWIALVPVVRMEVQLFGHETRHLCPTCAAKRLPA
jgi:hypothetical protein